jgi:enoyl-CoA hydratase/carnithine racemase
MIYVGETDPGVWHIELRRPEKRNALGVADYAALADALERIAASPDARAAVLSGRGNSFCAGNNLAEFKTHWPQSLDGPLMRFLNALSVAPVPVIAAIQGAAVGIGATMLLHCDIVIAASDAFLQFPFVDRGIAPEAASSLLLPLRIGYGRTMELFLTGRRVEAEEAVTLGLVTRVLKEQSPDRVALEVARLIAAKPSLAVRATKHLVRARLAESMAACFAEEIGTINRLLLSERRETGTIDHTRVVT